MDLISPFRRLSPRKCYVSQVTFGVVPCSIGGVERRKEEGEGARMECFGEFAGGKKRNGGFCCGFWGDGGESLVGEIML